MPKIRVTKIFEFDTAHTLHNYDGLCSNIHGHTYKLHVTVIGEPIADPTSPKYGMVVDFGKLKDDLKEETDKLDHALIAEKDSLMPETVAAMEKEGFRIVYFEGRPTAENLAKYFYDVIKTKGYQVIKVSVFETPDNQASYTE